MGNDRNRPVPLIILAVVAVLAGGTLGWARRPPAPQNENSSSAIESVPPSGDVIAVHVAGWVRSPGVVSLPVGAMVADAVEAAGGLLPGAATGALNLAAPVDDGNQIVVPGPDDAAGQTPAPGGDGLVSLNQATTSELETLPGVGPVLAERIVAFREENGPFETVEDLLEVPGIGESKLASMRDLVRP